MYNRPIYPNELYHHGIKGQKWGVRRYQTKDGTWTNAGLARRDKLEAKTGRNHSMKSDKRDTAVTKRAKDDWNKLSDQDFKNRYAVSKEKYQKRVYKYGDPYAKKMGIKNPNDKLTARQQKKLDKERKKEAKIQTQDIYNSELEAIKNAQSSPAYKKQEASVSKAFESYKSGKTDAKTVAREALKLKKIEANETSKALTKKYGDKYLKDAMVDNDRLNNKGRANFEERMKNKTFDQYYSDMSVNQPIFIATHNDKGKQIGYESFAVQNGQLVVDKNK